MKKHTLAAHTREIFGRKVKSLRTQGLIPATVYGKNIKSESMSFSADEFLKVFREAGESGLVELSLNGNIKPVLIHNVQRDPVTDAILHAELHQVDLKVKVTATVPLVFTGVSPIVEQKKGVLMTILDEVDVEALPTDLPEKIEIDISGLTAIDQEITVGNISVPKGSEIRTDKDLTIVKVGPLVSKEVEAEQAAEAAAAAAAQAEAAAVAGAEGQAKTEEPPKAPEEQQAKEKEQKTEKEPS